AGALDGGVVDEEVGGTVLGGDEPVPLLRVEPLDGALCHVYCIPFSVLPCATRGMATRAGSAPSPADHRGRKSRPGPVDHERDHFRTDLEHLGHTMCTVGGATATTGRDPGPATVEV